MKLDEVGTTLKHLGIINGSVKIYVKVRKGKIKENANFCLKKKILPVMVSNRK
jgi:hypothetical protein